MSKERIILSSLYLGTGALEKQLIRAIEEAKRANPELEVCLLFDFFRGTRLDENGESSATLLSKLAADNSRVFFFIFKNL